MIKKGAWGAWVPVGLYALVIFGLSATPGEYVPQLFPGSDKLFHLLEYAPFGFLVFRAVVFHRRSSRGPALLVSLIVVALYALSDETHQLFVPGREFSFFDMAFDVLGAGLGGLIHPWQR